METIADDIFHSIPTEGNGVQGVIERPLSDTSSDSGLDSQQILSPDLFDCITSGRDDEDDDEPDLHAVVNPRTNSPDPETVSFDTGATTIILPVITPVSIFYTSLYKRCDLFLVLARFLSRASSRIHTAMPVRNGDLTK